MHPRRLVRLNELIRQKISKIALNLKDPGVGFVTITNSVLSKDVSSVRIFYSVLGSADEKEKTGEALDRARSLFRREVAKLENLKKVPEIIFIYDDGMEKADRIYRILDTIEKEKKGNESNEPNA